MRRLLLSSAAALILLAGSGAVATAGDATAGDANAGNAKAGNATPSSATPGSATPAHAPAGRWADRAFAQAMQLLHTGRRADAYGRMVALANAGHPDAARLAITMCRHGLRLYGSDWDCSPAELNEWAHVSSQPAPGQLAASPRRP